MGQDFSCGRCGCSNDKHSVDFDSSQSSSSVTSSCPSDSNGKNYSLKKTASSKKKASSTQKSRNNTVTSNKINLNVQVQISDGRVDINGIKDNGFSQNQGRRQNNEEEKLLVPPRDNQQQDKQPAVGAPLVSPSQKNSNLKIDYVPNIFGHQPNVVEKPNLLTVKKGLQRFKTDYMIMAHFQIIKMIGKGSFGEVMKAKDMRTNKIRAIKKIKKSALQKEAGADKDKEYEILTKLNHPNIVKLLEFYQDDDFMYLVTEFCEGGELFDEIINSGIFSENMASEIMRQILSAVVYCHENHIVHRDLKPENLLLESKKSFSEGNIVKVIDFGTSIEFSKDEKLQARLGTAYYIAPEVLRGEYDEKCDVWSCGVILYILLCGYPPFNGDTDQQIFDRIKRGKFAYPSPEWDSVTQEAKDLVQKMLAFDPKDRISALGALSDPWILRYTKIKIQQTLNVNSLKNLQNFHSERKLQAAICQYIANQLISSEEEQELRMIFYSLDENGDGVLSREELRNGIELFGAKFGVTGEFQDVNVDNILKRIDIDGSGTVDIKEFITATMNLKNVYQGQSLRQAFDLFDIDGNGQITKKELQRVLGNVLELTDSQWDDFIKEVDSNNDGMINFDEFRQMVAGLVNKGGF